MEVWPQPDAVGVLPQGLSSLGPKELGLHRWLGQSDGSGYNSGFQGIP